MCVIYLSIYIYIYIYRYFIYLFIIIIIFFNFRLSCGTTWHAAGLLAAIKGSRAHTKLSMYSNELYPQLEQETGVGTSMRTVM